LKLTPPGFGIVLIWSVFFFFLTTVAYGAHEARPKSATEQTILESGSDAITLIVYLFGLLCWYFMILDGSTPPDKNYYKAIEQQEHEVNEEAQAFSRRIAKSEEEDK
jgi:hypothetical protein